MLHVAADDPGAFESVKSLKEQQFEARGFDPIDVAGKAGDHRDLGRCDKFANGRGLAERAAGAEMDDPVGKAVVHHAGQLRQLDAVAVQVDPARRAVKGEIKHAVIALAEQIKVVLELFAGIASQVAELRLHGLRDQLQRR